MMRKPFPQSFWVHEDLLCAGHYPGAQDSATRDDKLRGLLDCGIRRVLSLMEETETGHDDDPMIELLEANPLEDIRNTTHIHAVIVNGRVLDRARLDRLLADRPVAH